MKRIAFILCILLLCLTSCRKGDKVIPWTGDKIVSCEGGTAVWVVDKKKVNVRPCIHTICTYHYYSDSDCKFEKLRITKNQDRYEHDWFQINVQINRIEVTFQPNETSYTREVQIDFEDGSMGGNLISVKQVGIDTGSAFHLKQIHLEL